MSDSVQVVRVSAIRRAKITLGLAAFGGIGGAVAGGISALIVGAISTWSLADIFNGFLFLFGATIGAPLGTLLLPFAAWTVMRHVPFGRALAGTVTGTFVGGLIGWFITQDSHVLFRSVTGGIVGFTVAAVLLRLRAQAATSNKKG